MVPESPYVEHIRRANAAFLDYLDHLPTVVNRGDEERADRAGEVAWREAAEARRIREHG